MRGIFAPRPFCEKRVGQTPCKIGLKVKKLMRILQWSTFLESKSAEGQNFNISNRYQT